jgi:hypothetical protein
MLNIAWNTIVIFSFKFVQMKVPMVYEAWVLVLQNMAVGIHLGEQINNHEYSAITRGMNHHCDIEIQFCTIVDICRKHFPVLSSFMAYHWICN